MPSNYRLFTYAFMCFLVLILPFFLPSVIHASAASADSTDSWNLSRNQDRRLQNEVTLSGLSSYSTANTAVHFNDGYFMSVESENPANGASLDWIYRPYGRFEHGELPFFFVPYNYRGTVASLRIEHTRYKRESLMESDRPGFFPIPESSESWSGHGARLQGEHFFGNAYVAGEAGFAKLDREKSEISEQDYFFAGGLQNRFVRAGAGIRADFYQAREDATEESFRGLIKFSVTPTPFLVVRGEYEDLLDPEEDLVETAFRFEAMVFLPGNGLEFGLRGFHTSGYDDFRNRGVALVAGGHLENAHLQLVLETSIYDLSVYQTRNDRAYATVRARATPNWLVVVEAEIGHYGIDDMPQEYLDGFPMGGARSFTNEMDWRDLSVGVSRLF